MTRHARGAVLALPVRRRVGPGIGSGDTDRRGADLEALARGLDLLGA